MLIQAEGRASKHLQFIVSAVGYIVAGELLSLPGMSNAAKSWGVVYLFGRWCQVAMDSHVAILHLFLGFVALFISARFLSRNPKYITAALFGSA
jgi:hypothetical protein